MKHHILPADFFARDAQEVARALLGKVIRPTAIIQTARLGIPKGRDEHLPYRFVDAEYARHCSGNPLRRGQAEGRDYVLS